MTKVSSIAIITLWLLAFVANPASTLHAGSLASNQDPIKVFLLVGQSNMQGHGAIRGDAERNDGQGSLEFVVKDTATTDRYQHLVDENGDWSVRDDVWIWYFDRVGKLTAGYGARENCIGPELQFGHALGDHFEEPVLLIKLAWGGKSLAVDFRPPSAGGEVGPFYRELFQHVREVLGHLPTHIPEYDGRGYEILGFGWHQGWNDRVNQAFNDSYESNLVHFIRDVRKELESEALPFVIAETGMSGHEENHPRALSLMRAQAAVAERSEFRGNVAFVGTKDFYRPPEVSPSRQAYHWNSNAETHLLIGQGMADAMIELITDEASRR